MKEQSEGAVLAAKVSARIREFQTVRGLSSEALANAASLSAAEVLLLEEGSEDMTKDMVERIAGAFGVHPAVLYMFPDENALASLLEGQRDLPKDEFRKRAIEWIVRGFQRSNGSA